MTTMNARTIHGVNGKREGRRGGTSGRTTAVRSTVTQCPSYCYRAVCNSGAPRRLSFCHSLEHTMRSWRWIVLVAIAVGVGPALAAQGWIEEVSPVPGLRPGSPVEKIRGAVRVTVRGRVAQVVVEEWFRNTGGRMEEGTYHYPLPGEAVFASYSLWQGDQELRGETMDATQARNIYEEIVRRRKDPALIELAAHGLLRARVFPINPGETRKITLRYTQVLDRAGDAWRFRYVATPGDVAPRSFRLETDSASRFGDPYSPTHRVTTSRDNGRLGVTLADAGWTGSLELLLPLARGLVGLSLVTHEPAGEDGYFMLLVAPGMAQATAVRRDVVAVLDVSGSMSGEKLEQGKAALRQLLGSLRAGDRFRLVAFSGGVRRYAEGWTPLTAESRGQADGVGRRPVHGRRHQHLGRHDRGTGGRAGRRRAGRRGVPHRRPAHSGRDRSRTHRRCRRARPRGLPGVRLRRRS